MKNPTTNLLRFAISALFFFQLNRVNYSPTHSGFGYHLALFVFLPSEVSCARRPLVIFFGVKNELVLFPHFVILTIKSWLPLAVEFSSVSKSMAHGVVSKSVDFFTKTFEKSRNFVAWASNLTFKLLFVLFDLLIALQFRKMGCRSFGHLGFVLQVGG